MIVVVADRDVAGDLRRELLGDELPLTMSRASRPRSGPPSSARAWYFVSLPPNCSFLIAAIALVDLLVGDVDAELLGLELAPAFCTSSQIACDLICSYSVVPSFGNFCPCAVMLARARLISSTKRVFVMCSLPTAATSSLEARPAAAAAAAGGEDAEQEQNGRRKRAFSDQH